MRFNSKLGHEIRKTSQILCACNTCKSNLDKTWTTNMSPQQQLCYQPVHDFTHWPVLVCFNNWNIFIFSHKATTSEAFEEINKVVLHGTSDNVTSLVESVKYGNIKKRIILILAAMSLNLSQRTKIYRKTQHVMEK